MTPPLAPSSSASPATSHGAESPLRVLVVAESFLPQVNGVTRSVCRVLRHLAAAGHSAQIVAPTGPDTHAGFRVRHARGTSLPLYRDFRVGLETRRWLTEVMEEYQPDVVHLASPAVLGRQAAKAARGLGIPVVAIYQTDLVGFARRYPVPGGPAAMAALTRSIHRSVDRTLAPSRASVDQLAALGIDRVAHWPRGVDLDAFHPRRRDEAFRRALSPDGAPLVGYVGRLAAEKDLHLLAHLADGAVPPHRLVLVGDGPERPRLERLLPHASFTGVLHGPALSAAYASFDLFVHTGPHETYCQSAQEALASGVPVVAPDAGGPRDVVASGTTGLLYRAGDGRALAAHVSDLLEDDGRRLRMALAARPAVRDRSWDGVMETLVRHYHHVVGARVAPQAA